MGVNITYMGTKRTLAPVVRDVIRSAQRGVMLDAFSGMCAVGEAVGDARSVWNNDIQVFAAEVARALFTSKTTPPSPVTMGDLHFERYRVQRLRLSTAFKRSLALEDALTASRDLPEFEAAIAKSQIALKKDIGACRVRSPHLFATTYAGTFFGIRQAIDCDAIVAALRRAKNEGRTSDDDYRWGIIALGRALLKIANSTGHFAQYLTPKASNYRRFIALRRRSLWEEWLSSIAAMAPVSTPTWRRGNRVFNQDSLRLIQRLARSKVELGVIYADPPYTDDQYSRFYHILETLCLYDYPNVTGAGLYRADRFRTPFSLKAFAAGSLAQLIEDASKTGADLVLSYPAGGLAVKAGADISGMLRKHFRRVELCHALPHRHSTFGASKGSSHAEATELIFWGRAA